MNHTELTNRRRFLGYLAGSLGAVSAAGLFWMRQQGEPQGPYQVVDQRDLEIGGLGLFVAVDREMPREKLRAVGHGLRRQFQKQPNMVVMVFDDPEAARTVRKGSRIVGEESFQRALAHQVAFYLKDSRTGQHVLTIYAKPQEVVQY